MHVFRGVAAIGLLAMLLSGYANAESSGPVIQGPSQASQCAQEGGPLECMRAVAGPWTYRVKDLYNELHYKEEGDAYAYLLRVSPENTVFSLIYRWADADRAGYPTTKSHSMETSSWKVYQRCSPGDYQPDCNSLPQYVAYQRFRKVDCPDGYRFTGDPASPYCIPERVEAITKVALSGKARLRN
jgi:hypothetical protein